MTQFQGLRPATFHAKVAKRNGLGKFGNLVSCGPSSILVSAFCSSCSSLLQLEEEEEEEGKGPITEM